MLIKVAFWFDRPQEYTGGLNYMRNLLFALSVLEDKQIRPYIFFGKNVDPAVVRPFEALATVVRASMLDRKSISWYLHQIFFRIFGSLLMVHLAIRRHGISIVSHSDRICSRSRSFRIISWIPDFQYLHLPDLFPRNPEDEVKRMRTLVAHTDALVLSSYAALEDFRCIADPRKAANVTVLPFVSQPGGASEDMARVPTLADIETKYGFHGHYFFLPNQFWEHKNHGVVFAAVKTLRDRGIDVLLLCTGNLQDYRVTHTAYADKLRQFIDDNDLRGHIKILGLIDYADVLYLMRYCVSVVNPSRFEGWSSTVEEARSMGKRLILSDISVHREQNPPRAVFFRPDDEQGLARLMLSCLEFSTDAVSVEDERRTADDLMRRTLAFAERYTGLVLALEGKTSAGTDR